MCRMKTPQVEQQKPITPVSAPQQIVDNLSIAPDVKARKMQNASAGMSNLIIPRDVSVGSSGGSGLGIGR